MMISLKCNSVQLIIVAIAATVVGCSVIRQQLQQDYSFLSQRCNEINADVTRPVNRECTDAVSFKDGVFTFINKGGVTEQYLVIEDSSGDFVYTFIDYLEE